MLRFLSPEAQRVVVRAILNSDRLRREDAEPLGQELIKELGLPQIAISRPDGISDKTQMGPVHHQGTDRQPRFANEITEAIRKQLHAKYDADEVKQSWLVLAESRNQVLVTIVADVVRAYAHLRTTQRRLEIARQDVAVQERMENQVRAVPALGLTTETDLCWPSESLS